MKKILSNVLPVCTIFLIVSCSSGCKKFNWEPRPFIGDYEGQQLLNIHGVTVKCDQPSFNNYTCFDSDNIAELKTAIDNLKIKKKDKKKLKDLVDKSLAPK